MFDTQSAPYKAWIKYGKTVVDNNPKGLVVVSAHWENPQHTDAVVVNEDPTNPLVYDFYGFPAEYYQQKFESKGNPAMLADVKTALRESGMQVSGAKRGLDHGVWGESESVTI
jgi:aromatic ring-opening dioxygenase catalytic subunit (LigB family)